MYVHTSIWHNGDTNLLHCKWQKACPAFLCPHSGSAAPGWTGRTGCPTPSCHLSPCLFLCLVPFLARRSVAAGAEPRAGALWRSQRRPGDARQMETRIRRPHGERLWATKPSESHKGIKMCCSTIIRNQREAFIATELIETDTVGQTVSVFVFLSEDSKHFTHFP